MSELASVSALRAAELPADEEVRALAREILARGEYDRWRPHNSWAQLRDRIERFIESAIDAVTEWLPDWFVALLEAFFGLFDRLGIAPGDPADLSLLEWVIGALLLAVVGMALFGLAGSVMRRRAGGGDGGQGSDQDAAPPLPLQEARALAAGGHFLAAAHHVQLAALQMLLERRFVELARSEPNTTLRRRLSGSSLPEAEKGDFLSLLDRLEAHWFRDREDDRVLYLDWCQLHTRLDALRRRA
jgi:hypothetical protein